jgi:hypothetical protein
VLSSRWPLIAVREWPNRRCLPDQPAQLTPPVACFPAKFCKAALKVAIGNCGFNVGVVPIIKGQILSFMPSRMLVTKSNAAMQIVIRTNSIRVRDHAIKPYCGIFSGGENISSRSPISIHQLAKSREVRPILNAVILIGDGK